jgi:hypothetical protein
LVAARETRGLVFARRAVTVVAALALPIGIACSSDSSSEGQRVAPSATPASPELTITSFDVVEPGWGDAPVAVHFTWAIASTTGRPLTCLLDFDGDGTVDRQIDDCKGTTLGEPIDGLPTHAYAKPGKHVPKLVVTDGMHTATRTQNIYANQLTYAKNVVLPETRPGFVKAEAVPNTSVVLTYSSEAEVPDIKAGDIVWGTSGFGYLIKATEATRSGATVTVKGVQGKLGEAIENGYLGARDVLPRYEDARCLDEACAGVTFERLSDPVLAPGLGIQSLGTKRDPLEINGNFGIKLALPTLGAPVEHSIFVGVRVKEFELKIEWFDVKLLNADIVAGFNYEISILKEEHKSFLLGSISLGTIVIGPAVITPIVFPTLTLAAKLKLTGSIGFDVPLHAVYTAENGIDVTIDPTRRGVVQDILDPIAAGTSLEAEAKLSFPLKALFFGIAGPYVGPTLGLGGELRAGTPALTDNPCKKLVERCAQAKVTFGGEYGMGCPWIEEIDKKWEITAAEIELWKRCVGRDENDPDKCADAGVPGDGDAGQTDPQDGGQTDPKDSGTSTPATPEISVAGFLDQSTDMVGERPVGVAFSRSYTFTNDGLANLTLGTLGTSATNCTIVATTSPAGLTLFPGSSASLTVSVTPTAPGPFSCSFSLANNDADENPYDISIDGTGKLATGGDYIGSIGVVGDPFGHDPFVWAATSAGKAAGIRVAQNGAAMITITPLSGFTPSTLPTLSGTLVNSSVALTGQGTVAGFPNVRIVGSCNFTGTMITCPDWEVGAAGGTSLPNGPIHYSYSGTR